MRSFALLSEELPARLPRGLAPDVPEGHVDGADGADHRAAAAVHGAPDVELLPEPLGLERVLPEEHVLEPAAHGVRAGGLDARRGRSRG